MRIEYVYYTCEISFGETVDEFSFETEDLLDEDELLLIIDEEYGINYETYYEVQDLKAEIKYKDIHAERDIYR